jgi:vacuolar-type H+-ATPase subunit F/Vma7
MKLAVISDEITALGWRLAGAEVQTPDAGGVEDCLRAALGGAELVLITADLASRVPLELLEQALHAVKPLFLVIPDLRHRGPVVPAIEDEIGRALGIAV